MTKLKPIKVFCNDETHANIAERAKQTQLSMSQFCLLRILDTEDPRSVVLNLADAIRRLAIAQQLSVRSNGYGSRESLELLIKAENLLARLSL